MNIRYINLYSDRLCTLDEDFRHTFNFNCRFICNWMSRNVRKLKLPTDGTFKFISIDITNRDVQSRLLAENVFSVPMKWTENDMNTYLSMKEENTRILFYIDLLKQGFIEAAKVKDIHLDELNSLLETFVENGCKNEWLFKSVRLKDYGVILKFNCVFHTYDFELILTVYDLKKNKLAEKVIFKTYPDEIFYSREIRKIVIEGDTLFINDDFDHHFLSIDLPKLKEGIIDETILNEDKKPYIFTDDTPDYKRLRWET